MARNLCNRVVESVEVVLARYQENHRESSLVRHRESHWESPLEQYEKLEEASSISEHHRGRSCKGKDFRRLLYL